MRANIVVEHEEGFYNALRQATVLLNVHEPFDVGFDIEKDMYGGKLVHLGPLTVYENPDGDGNVELEGASSIVVETVLEEGVGEGEDE